MKEIKLFHYPSDYHRKQIHIYLGIIIL